MNELPAGWAGVSFGQINFQLSSTVDPSDFPETEFELYSVPQFPVGKPEIQAGNNIGSTKQVVQLDDVLVCKINPRINRVWVVDAPSGRKQIASSEWIVFRNQYLNSKYLRHYFSSQEFRDLICQDLTGVGGSLTRAQPKRVAEYPIPIAPLNEQKRIADKLDQTLAIVERAKARLARVPEILKQFRQSVLAAATDGRLTEDWRNVYIPDISQWKSLKLRELVTDSANGLSKRKADAGLDTVVLRLADFKNSLRVAGAERVIKLSDKEVDKYLLKDGDLLVVRVNGSRDLAARFINYENSYGKTEAYCDHFIRLRLKAQIISPKFALYVANSGKGREYLEGELITSAGQNTINQSSLFGLLIELPSYSEQTEIIRRVETLFALADRIEARYKAIAQRVDKLTQSLLTKAFRGELVPQDPNDEPASVLLERIRTERSAAILPPQASRRRLRPSSENK